MGEGYCQATRIRKMPPWFADPCCGKFSNDRSMAEAEIAALDALNRRRQAQPRAM